ncbi:SAM-dependent methyltransferase [Nocardia vaccinii]|nr:SAM-dependent methyltransferase [Nocardia vaccinii]
MFRTARDLEAMFGGFELLEPGIVPVQDWLADDLLASRWVILSGIGRM